MVDKVTNILQYKSPAVNISLLKLKMFVFLSAGGCLMVDLRRSADVAFKCNS